MPEEASAGAIEIAPARLKPSVPLRSRRVLSAEAANWPQALPGGHVTDWESYQARQRTAIAAIADLPGDVIEDLINTYGAEVGDVLALITEKPALARRVTPDLPVINAQIVYAIRREMALTLTDVLDRRTSVLTHALDQGLGAVQAAANLMAAELGWTPQECATQVAYYRYEAAKSHFWRDKQLAIRHSSFVT